MNREVFNELESMCEGRNQRERGGEDEGTESDKDGIGHKDL